MSIEYLSWVGEEDDLVVAIEYRTKRERGTQKKRKEN